MNPGDGPVDPPTMSDGELIQWQESEIDRLQADAKRYVFIRDNQVRTGSHHMDGTCCYGFRSIFGRAGTFDKLIDAKISESAEYAEERARQKKERREEV